MPVIVGAGPGLVKGLGIVGPPGPSPSADIPIVSGIKNNGPAHYDLLLMAGVGFLLSATPAPDTQWQANQAEHQSRTHELALAQSQQFSFLLRAETPTVVVATNQAGIHVLDPANVIASPSFLLRASAPAVAATNQGKVLIGTPQVPDTPESASWSQYIDFFDPPLLKPLVLDPGPVVSPPSMLLKSFAPTGVTTNATIKFNAPAFVPDLPSSLAIPRFEQSLLLAQLFVVDPDRPQEFASKLAQPRFEAPLASQPRLLVLDPVRPPETTASLAIPRFEAASVDFAPKIIVADKNLGQEEFGSKALIPREPAVATNQARILVADVNLRGEEFPSKSLPAQVPLTPTGINPHIFVVQPQDDFWQLFTSQSRLTIPNHVEPFVPPPPSESESGRVSYLLPSSSESIIRRKERKERAAIEALQQKTINVAVKEALKELSADKKQQKSPKSDISNDDDDDDVFLLLS